MKDSFLTKMQNTVVYKKIENFMLLNADVRHLNVVAVAKGSGKSVSKSLTYESETMQAQTLKDWTVARLAATDPDNPDKTGIAKLYKNLLLDNHLVSVIDSRIFYCKRSPFRIVNEAGDENLDLSWLFERTWWEEFIELCLKKNTEGTKLIEIFDKDPITGELASIDEIPMQYFNAKKGIITKEPGGNEGWDYKEGELARFYIQVGKDNELGMLADMAPIILAKKLGFGSWLDYIEKYGVPALFITTDREDDARLKELFEAASNFKSNGFMVGRGQEKFDISETSGGNAANFDMLIERANSEMAKRLLGGAGLTDEKSFVGSSEIQFRLAKDRFMSDKLLIKNIVNQQLFPRLVKLSPVYAPLVNHYFEWDESEPQSSKEVAELVAILAPHFELDTEELSQKTGLTIVANKMYGTTEQTPTDAEAIKKKSLIGK